MRKAVPYDRSAARSMAGPARATGRPLTVPGVAATEAPPKKTVAATPAVSATVGKVFFHDPVRRQDGTCSAATVNSSSKMLVATAGHCVHGGGPGKTFYTSWVFAPLYWNGIAPYGLWSAKFFMPATGWTTRGDLDRDVAFVTLHPNAEGKKIVNVVGGNSISVNQPFIQEMTLAAYPGAAPFDGQTQQLCVQSSFRPFLGDRWAHQVALLCKFTPGASGGPFLRNYKDGRGAINGVYSTFDPLGTNYSPYFDSSILALYQAAAPLT